MNRTRAFTLIFATSMTISPAVLASGGDSGSGRPRGQAPPGLGMDPSALTIGDEVVPTGPVGEAAAAGSDGFQFHFHGFLRIPVRIGIGSGKNFAEGVEKGTKFHIPPQIPDSSYSDWRYIDNMGGPWTELRLAYANSNIAANISIAAYDVTDGSYRDLQAQLGINQAFVTLKFPELFGRRGGIVANVGAFSNRYGAAGRYGAGKYQTYLIGATHVAGETVRAFVDLNKNFTVHAEHGVGAKLQAPPFVADTHPSLPYSGPAQQGSTLVHHAHAGVSYNDKLTLGMHYLTSWTDDARLPEEKDGRITSLGGDLKLNNAFFGDAYLGFSHVKTRDLVRVSGALEVLHSIAGWSVRDNYFGNASSGTGSINSIMGQYTFSLSRFLWHPQEFWGQSRDLTASVFGMYNRVNSDDANFTGAKEKMKVGGELTYTPLTWLGVSTRYDLVQPNMDDNTQSFQVLSPRLVLRSSFVSHEQVVLQYSRYFYGENVMPTWPHEELEPDANALKISAVMWW